MRVTTGGPVPQGADAVIQVEDTELAEADVERDIELKVRIMKASSPGQDIRPVGSDIALGDVVLHKGTVIGPAEIGLLSMVGAFMISVYRSPVVAVLSTGDELVDATDEGQLPDGCIRDSNRPALLAALNSLGITGIDLGIAKDSAQELEGKMLYGLEKADLLITSGGISMGELDLIKPFISKHGGILHFGRVMIKPAKPSTFASFPGKGMLFGCPGNPVSALTAFHLFVVPMLRKMQGVPYFQYKPVDVKIRFCVQLDHERPEYHRAVVQWNDQEHCLVADTTGNQLSSRLTSLRSANAFLALPKGNGLLNVGAIVKAYLIAPLCVS
jgi:gephyrin